MPLEGLRAWIGEVERKLGKRTRVFLVLTAIAVGGAGAGIYLAVEAQNDSVSESDVRALQEQLEERMDTLRAQVEALGAGTATEGTATPPTEGPVTPPTGSPAAPPTEGPVTPPKQGTTTTPKGGETKPPKEDETAPPQEPGTIKK